MLFYLVSFEAFDISNLVSSFVDEGHRKSLSHVFDRRDEFMMTSDRNEGNSGYETMETFDHTVVLSRSLRLIHLSPPPSPTKNKQTSMRAPAPPPLVA